MAVVEDAYDKESSRVGNEVKNRAKQEAKKRAKKAAKDKFKQMAQKKTIQTSVKAVISAIKWICTVSGRDYCRINCSNHLPGYGDSINCKPVRCGIQC